MRVYRRTDCLGGCAGRLGGCASLCEAVDTDGLHSLVAQKVSFEYLLKGYSHLFSFISVCLVKFIPILDRNFTMYNRDFVENINHSCTYSDKPHLVTAVLSDFDQFAK